MSIRFVIGAASAEDAIAAIKHERAAAYWIGRTYGDSYSTADKENPSGKNINPKGGDDGGNDGGPIGRIDKGWGPRKNILPKDDRSNCLNLNTQDECLSECCRQGFCSNGGFLSYDDETNECKLDCLCYECSTPCNGSGSVLPR